MNERALDEEVRFMGGEDMPLFAGLVGIAVFASTYFCLSRAYYWSSWEAGTNTRNRARRWLLKDLRYARQSVHVVVSVGSDAFWGGKVASCLRKLADKNVKIEFIVGPLFDNPPENASTLALHHLEEEGKITVVRTPITPLSGLRLVDDRALYVCGPRLDPDDPSDPRRYFRARGLRHKRIIEDQKRFIAYFRGLADQRA